VLVNVPEHKLAQWLFLKPVTALLFAVSLFHSTPCRAAAPADELLRLVPEDVGFCVVLRDLRGHAASFQKSPFLEQFQKSPLAKPFEHSEDLKKLLFLDDILEKNLGVNSAKLLDEIFGDAVVFAYRPGPPDHPEAEQGLFLLKAKNEETLSVLIKKLNAVQKDDVKELVKRTYQGEAYYRRVEAKGENYYWQSGTLLAVSTQEAILRQAIDRQRSVQTSENIPLIKQLRGLKADKQFITLWINPQAFQEEIKRKSEGKQENAAAVRAFLNCWQALEGISLSLDLQEDLEVMLGIRLKPDRLPEAGWRLFAAMGKPTELWNRLPADALFAANGRLDILALVDLVAEFLTPEMRQAARLKIERSINAVLDKDLLTDILPFVGPEWGFYVAAPPKEEAAWFPQALFACQVRPGDKSPPVDQTLLAALTSLAQMGIIAYNNQPDVDKEGPLYLKTVSSEKGSIKYITGSKRFPPGLQPAFALQDGHLLLATSPETIRNFVSVSTKVQVIPESDELPILRISFKETARFLRDRREPLAAFLAERNQLSKEEVAERLNSLGSVFDVLDQLSLTQRNSEGQSILTLRVKTVKPLK
jgi:hypothetical protein